MKFVTLDDGALGRPGVLVGDDVLEFVRAARIVPFAAFVPSTVAAVLAGGAPGLEVVRRVMGDVEAATQGESDALRESGALAPHAGARLLAPLPRPGLVLSHGRAYLSHLKEMQKDGPPKIEENPSGFIKNQNAIVGPGAPIVLPPQCPDMVDFEGEFSLVFGSRCHNVQPADAMGHVAGYTIINDVSARNWVHTFRATGDPEVNRMGKQLPSFCPLGPVVVIKDEVPDPHQLRMTTTLNGKVYQDCTTEDLIWRIPDLISYFSRWYQFEAGDVLTTGSPPGVGFGRNPQVFMKAGDTIAVTVDRVGTLANPIVAG